MGHINGNDPYFYLFILLAITTPILWPPSSRHAPVESPEHVFCVLLGSVHSLWVSWHVSFPACPSSHVGRLGAFRGDMDFALSWQPSWGPFLPLPLIPFLEFLMWARKRWDNAIFSLLGYAWISEQDKVACVFSLFLDVRLLFLTLRYEPMRIGRPWIKLRNIKNCIKTIALSSPWFLVKILISIFWETPIY